MYKSQFILSLLIVILDVTYGHPIDPKDVQPADTSGYIAVLAVAFLITGVLATAICLCCKKRRDGFKEFTNSGSTSNVGFTNALATEVAIFPPPGAVSSHRQDVPLVQPVLNQPPSKPAGFSSVAPDISDWFADQNGNFPRQQLFYQKEIGKGWFGKVVEGEARGTKVVVRILREDATPEEKAYFLHEAKAFRDLRHKNVCKLFGRCLEHDPYLLLFELYSNRDLKNFLIVNTNSKRAIFEQGICLKLMTDVCEGIKFMNDNGFIHTDLAARNCLVASDLTVKIGDYGTSIDSYKNEYYIAGDIAVPIRWCAPETLHCTSTTIETKQVTAAANVWSLAIVLWEISEFGKLPYGDLSDDQVIVKVLGEEKYRLSQPDCPFGQYLYNIMQICWRMENRATIEQVISMLQYLKTNPFQESDFESRWKKLKPNTVPIIDNHTPIHSPRHTELAQRPKLQAKCEFDSGVDLEIKPSDDNVDSYKTSSPMTISPQLSVTSEDIFQTSQKKSPSLTNLKGSLEDVSQFDSWLQGVEQKTEEDRKFVRNISEAIKNLDETLALEKTSSSSADSSMECPKKPLLDFKLGPLSGRKSESSSDTEEETWRHRIERGEFTEKVKEKSKSVTDLMVLTHIDSEESENDSLPSLTKQYSMKRNGSKGATYTSIGFGSEGNIRNAILSEELQEKLRALTSLWKTDDSSLLGGASKKSFDDSFLGKPLSKNDEKPKIEPINEPLLAQSGESVDELFLAQSSAVTNEPLLAQSDKPFGEQLLPQSSQPFSENLLAQTIEPSKEHVLAKNNDPFDIPFLVQSTSELIQKDELKAFLENEISFNSNTIKNEEPSEIDDVVDLSDIKIEPKSEGDSFLVEAASVTISNKNERIDCCDKNEVDDVNMYSNVKGLSNVNSVDEFVNIEEVPVADDVDIVNKECTYFTFNESFLKKSEEVVESILTEAAKIIEEKNNVENDRLENVSEDHSSPQDCVPKIVITESELAQEFENEKSEIQFKVDYKPRKFVFVMDHESEDSSDEESSVSTQESLHSLNLETNIYCDSGVKDVDSKNESSVILGSCEEHTLDYFKGLKTTFSPSEQYSDDESEIKDWPSSPIKEGRILDDDVEPEIYEKSQQIQEYQVPIKETISETSKPLIVDKIKLDDYVEYPINKIENTNFDSPSSSDSPKNIKMNGDIVNHHMSKRSFLPPAIRHINSKVSKSKSLDSILGSKGELESSKLSGGPSDVLPVFNMADYVTEDLFQHHNGSFDSYFSVDSGHSSDRCIDQDRQMNDLKSRLEDVMKYGDDFQLRSSEEEYGGKLLTPDDERSSDSGFRDKGSLSESVEDTCDEKYNLEDIDAELDDYTIKTVEKDEMKYYEQFVNERDCDKTNAPLQNIEGWFLHPKTDNRPVDQKENGWVSLSTEDDEKQEFTIEEEFVTAIRNELKEKLPCAQQTQKSEEENSSPEQELADPAIQFTYPAQLSPILEEQESNQSSLLLDDASPVLILPPPDINIDTFKEDIIKALDFKDSPEVDTVIIEDLEDGKEIILPADKYPVDDDVLVIDTETNEVTLIESPKPQSHLAFVLPRKINENFRDDDSTGINSETYIVSPDNVPLTPDISLGSNTLSSPENGNMSGLYMSPCSIRSDLFDSGPPSLPFDLGQSLEEVEEISLGKPNTEGVEIVQDLIDAGIVTEKDVIKSEEKPILEKDSTDPFSIEPAFSGSQDIFAEEPIKTNVEDIKDEYEMHQESINSSKIDCSETKKSNENMESPDKSIELQKETSKKETTETPPVIVVEEETPKHKKAELEIDLLIEKPETPSSTANVNENEVKIETKLNQHSWLNELFNKSEEIKTKLSPLGEDQLDFSKKDWPTSDELISPVSSEDKSLNIRPNIHSTLALLSPDLSSNDSKCQSLISSFASTPTYDDSKLLQDSISESSSSRGDYSIKSVQTPNSLHLGSSTMPVPMPSPEDAEKGWRPTICQLMELTDQAEGEEMTTSFIEPDENGIYTPDWESDTSDEQSSSSGEFVWKLQEPVKMERIDEEEENDESDSDDDDSSSEGSGTEFVPSTWDPSATPMKSALRSPSREPKQERKKVVFKKEKYQCIYEYPKEISDDEDGPDPWNTPSSSAIDYSTFTDLITDDGEFFISSSSKAFDWSDDTDRSEFFPGRESEDGSIDFSPSACELTPLNLGELRHTKDSLRLELPTISRQADKAEACILDSGIDTASPLQDK